MSEKDKTQHIESAKKSEIPDKECSPQQVTDKSDPILSDKGSPLNSQLVFPKNLIEKVEVDKRTRNYTNGLDSASRDRAQTEYESDQGYQKVTDKIIDKSADHLEKQQRSKCGLRKTFTIFFSILLSIQYVCLVAFISLNALECCPFSLSEELLKLYIVSVFLETLSAMGVMIAFAFASKDETKIVELLNNIIENYQKVKIGNQKTGQVSSMESSQEEEGVPANCRGCNKMCCRSFCCRGDKNKS